MAKLPSTVGLAGYNPIAQSKATTGRHPDQFVGEVILRLRNSDQTEVTLMQPYLMVLLRRAFLWCQFRLTWFVSFNERCHCAMAILRSPECERKRAAPGEPAVGGNQS